MVPSKKRSVKKGGPKVKKDSYILWVVDYEPHEVLE